jgi:hypothetical protein
VDWPALLLKLSHVGLAMLLVAGLIGRRYVLEAARRSDDVRRTTSLLRLSDPFERIVVWSSMAILPAGLLTAWAQGYDWLGLTTGWMLASTIIYVGLTTLVPLVFLPRGRAFAEVLAAAEEQGSVTPELTAAFADPAVKAARRAEIIGLALIVTLMVVKPF